MSVGMTAEEVEEASTRVGAWMQAGGGLDGRVQGFKAVIMQSVTEEVGRGERLCSG